MANVEKSAGETAPKLETVQIRHVPKFGAFMIAGAVFGAVFGLGVFEFVGNTQAEGWGAVMALLALGGAAIGGLIGLAWALLLERKFAKRAKVTQAAKLEG
jgi:hypothetical protein